MGVHPTRPDTVWTIPLNGADRGRFMPDAKSAVWRSDDAGKTWERCSEGLPQSNAYQTVLRDAMGVEANDPVGVERPELPDFAHGGRQERGEIPLGIRL